jgi:hypothetical protein
MATYVYRDPVIRRPYFANVHAPGGLQVTRQHPPGPDDPNDHPTMHPGLWMAFGDLGGSDFWRNKGTVEHVAFDEPPQEGPGRGSFAVSQRYRSHDGTIVAREVARFLLLAEPRRTLLRWESTFVPEGRELVFGDQEEMGLGVRLATPLAAKQGRWGRLIDAEGRVGEPSIRGTSALWCSGTGTLDGRSVSVTLLVDPDHFRPSWWHARDYGLMVANPFGRAALTGGAPDRTRVKPGESLTLRFGVALETAEPGQATDPASSYRLFLANRTARVTPRVGSKPGTETP